MKIKTNSNEKTKNIQITEFPDSFQDFLCMILNPTFYEFTIQSNKTKNIKNTKNPLFEEPAMDSGNDLHSFL